MFMSSRFQKLKKNKLTTIQSFCQTFSFTFYKLRNITSFQLVLVQSQTITSKLREKMSIQCSVSN